MSVKFPRRLWILRTPGSAAYQVCKDDEEFSTPYISLAEHEALLSRASIQVGEKDEQTPQGTAGLVEGRQGRAEPGGQHSVLAGDSRNNEVTSKAPSVPYDDGLKERLKNPEYAYALVQELSKPSESTQTAEQAALAYASKQHSRLDWETMGWDKGQTLNMLFTQHGPWARMDFLAGVEWGKSQAPAAVEPEGRVYSDEDDLLTAWGKFRRAIRQVLYENGIKSNPGWSDDSVVEGIRLLAAKVTRPGGQKDG